MLKEIHVCSHGMIPLSAAIVFDEDAVEKERAATLVHRDVVEDLMCGARQRVY